MRNLCINSDQINKNPYTETIICKQTTVDKRAK